MEEVGHGREDRDLNSHIEDTRNIDDNEKHKQLRN